jgi:hypothetical protein
MIDLSLIKDFFFFEKIIELLNRSFFILYYFKFIIKKEKYSNLSDFVFNFIIKF